MLQTIQHGGNDGEATAMEDCVGGPWCVKMCMKLQHSKALHHEVYVANQTSIVTGS